MKYVALIDAYYTYPAKYLSTMIKLLKENPEIGMVCGNRLNKQLELDIMPVVFHIGNKILSFAHELLNGVHMDDPLTGLRVVRREIVGNWNPKSKGFEIEVEHNHLVENRGYLIVEIPIEYKTSLGEKKLSPKYGFTLFKRILIETSKVQLLIDSIRINCSTRYSISLG